MKNRNNCVAAKASLLLYWICYLTSFKTSQAAVFDRSVAAIFGMGSPKGEEERGPPAPGRSYPMLPPPPLDPQKEPRIPPLPTDNQRGLVPSTSNCVPSVQPMLAQQWNEQAGNETRSVSGSFATNQMPPLPPNSNQGVSSAFHPARRQPQQIQRLIPPPPLLQKGTWQESSWIPQRQQYQQQQAPPQQQHFSNREWTNNPPPPSFDPIQLQHDLEFARQREKELRIQISNMTRTAVAMKQREDLHTRQLDVLTERVMAVEANGASDRNRLVEYKANCTQMGKQIAALEGEIEEWQKKCAEFADLREEDQKEIGDYKRQLKAVSREAEDLAAMIERHRLREERAVHTRKKQKKSRGFLGWIFGLGDDEEENWEGMHDAARATLLKALQTERASVEELEAAVMSLQQNNTAIAEQVQSRDLIIDELNDRVDVFEEDKVVLKAALRQLQKEMNDEAPKTRKLVHDLSAARKEVKRLEKEIQSLISTHQKELNALQSAISDKQSKIHEKESNLTVIGTYVDKLEERLADFAVARRDIELREQKCKDVEQAENETRRERDILQSRIEELEREQYEVKTLLDDLVRERGELRKESRRLSTERESLQHRVLSMRGALNKLQEESAELRSTKEGLLTQMDRLEAELKETKDNRDELYHMFNSTSSESESLSHQMEDLLEMKEKLEEALRKKDSDRQNLEMALRSSEESVSVLAQKMDNMAASRLEDRKQYEIKTKALTEKLAEQQQALKKAEEREVSRPKPIFKPPNSGAGNLPPPLPTKPRNSTLVENKRLPLTSTVPTLVISNSTKTNEMLRNDTIKHPPFNRSIVAGQRPKLKRAPSLERKVPLRGLRKFLSKTTGIHGFFTTPSQRSLDATSSSDSVTVTPRYSKSNATWREEMKEKLQAANTPKATSKQ